MPKMSGRVVARKKLTHEERRAMFALRMLPGGKTEGQTILITKKRDGVGGRAFNRAVLAATKVVGDYFAKGDTQVFQTMQFDFKTPTKADHANR